MYSDALQSTIEFYKKLWVDLLILVFGLIGGSLATYFDVFGLIHRLDNFLAYGIYTLLSVICSFPIIFLIYTIRSHTKLSKLLIDVSERIDNGVSYIGAVITNGDNPLECFCVLKSIKLNGHVDNELKYQITQHTDRISWSGGSDKDVGIKHVSSGNTGTINLVSLRGIGTLVFETAKGERGSNLGTGIYEIGLVLHCSTSGGDSCEKPFSVTFEYLFEGQQASVPFHSNVLSGNWGNYRIRLLSNK